jgi:hypothetical protein
VWNAKLVVLVRNQISKLTIKPALFYIGGVTVGALGVSYFYFALGGQ